MMMLKAGVWVSILVSWILLPWAIVQSQDRFRSNGERIYHSRTNAEGLLIPFEKGPEWLKGRKVGCVACHGPQGKGGILIWPSLKTAPDIRYDSLLKEKHSHGGKKEAHGRYSDALIRRAVTQGVNPSGKPFDPVMPRWTLSNEDLDDLMEYLKQLSKGISPPPEPFPREP
jgi:mono/diheme cytochrome c family protein